VSGHVVQVGEGVGQAQAEEVVSTAPDSVWLRPAAKLGISLIDHLFNRLDGAYLGKWRKDFPDEQSVANWRESWAEAFDEAGITPDQVKMGLRTVRMRYDWPPSVSEFIKACCPAIDPLLAYQEAIAGLSERSAGRMGTWSHRAVFWSAMSMKALLRSQTYAQVKTPWEHALTVHFANGDLPEIQEPRPELPAPGQGRLHPDRARSFIEERRCEQAQAPAVGYDRLGWARAIVTKAKSDKSVTPTVCEMAEQALGLR
jgi:hypothetical protein